MEYESSKSIESRETFYYYIVIYNHYSQAWIYICFCNLVTQFGGSFGPFTLLYQSKSN